MKHYDTLLPQEHPFYKEYKKHGERSLHVHGVKIEKADSLAIVLEMLAHEHEADGAIPLLLRVAKDTGALYSENACNQFETMWREQNQHPHIVGISLAAGESGLPIKRLALRLGIPFVQMSDQELETDTNTFPYERYERELVPEATKHDVGTLHAGHKTTRVAAPFLVPPSVKRMLTRSTKRFPRTRVLLVTILFILITASVFGAFALAQQKALSGLASVPRRIGQATFVNSSHGINDALQVRLTALPPLSPGQVYTVWLLSDQKQSDTVWLNLGSLPANDQTRTFTPSDGSHINLFTKYSKICITAPPLTYIPTSRSDCHYYGEIAQQENMHDFPDHYSLLDHVRHLLSSDPTLEAMGIHNGLLYNFSGMLGKINEWASASVGSTGDMSLAHRHTVRILDVLDGSKYVKKDVPLGTGLLVDSTSVGVGVMYGDATTPSYLGHIIKHLSGILNSPGVTSEQMHLATHILEEIQHIADELANVYNDARSLVHMSNAQLAQATEILQDMASNASNAYAGGYATALAQTRTDGSKDLFILFQQFGVIDIYEER